MSGIEISQSITMRSRMSFALSHLLSAAHFTKCIGEIERLHTGQPFSAFWDQIEANSVAVVFAACAGLEAYANEILIDHRAYYPEREAADMIALWPAFERMKVLDKFEKALELKGLSAARGTKLWQDIDVLVDLRNALTHFKAEWSDEVAAHAKISRRLRKKAVASEFITGLGQDLFPVLWMSHGTAVWVVSSVVNFIKAFDAQVPPPWAKISTLETRLADL